MLNYKTTFVLLFVVATNLVVFILLGSLDGFVHVDLYGYGLIFNGDWANEYWQLNGILWTLLSGATVFSAVSMVPHYLHSKKPSRLSKWTGFFLPVAAMTYQAISIMYLNQINGVVWNRLYDYGVRYDINWSTTYNPISIPALILMVVALFALVIPTIKTLDIIEIEIVQEDEFENVAPENSEEESEQQKMIQPLASSSLIFTNLEKEEKAPKILVASTILKKEEVEPKSLTILKSTEHAILLSTAPGELTAKPTTFGISETEPSVAVLQSTEIGDSSEKHEVENKKETKKSNRVKAEALTVITEKTTKERRKHSPRRRKSHKLQASPDETVVKDKKQTTAKTEKVRVQKTTQKAMQSSSITSPIVLPGRKKKPLKIVATEKVTSQKTGRKRKKRSRRKRRKTLTKAPLPKA